MRVGSIPKAVGLLTIAVMGLGVRCASPSPPLPGLAASDPPASSTVPRSTWFVLDFDGEVDPESSSRVVASCDGWWVPIDLHALAPERLVVRPRPDWPAGLDCVLMLSTEAGMESVAFQTLADGVPFVAQYDRRDRDQPLPFPDDFFLEPDASTATGYRPNVILPRPSGTARQLLRFINRVVKAESDGWSPIGNLAIHVTREPDPDSLPLDRAASLDPLASVALIDLTPGSPQYGKRVPFQTVPHSHVFEPEPISHDILFWPGIPLEPTGTYGLVVTDRLLDTTGEPLARSSFFDAVVRAPRVDEDPEVSAARPLAEEVLAVAEELSPVPIPRQDVVLAVRLTVRSTAHFATDLLSMRDDVLATPPNVQIARVTRSWSPDVAALVEGTFDVPVWRAEGPFLDRGPDGLPSASGTRRLEFLLALPASAASGVPAPLVMYQHGSPGDAWELTWAADAYLAAEGFAVGGITDVTNQLFPGGDWTLGLFGPVLLHGRTPDFWVQSNAEQLAFLHMLRSLDGLDLLPAGAPDGLPDLDPSRIVYEGISAGSGLGQSLLPYAPELRAAALVVGAERFLEVNDHQDQTLPSGGEPFITEGLPDLVDGIRGPDLWMGLALLAIAHDPQDPHNHARFLYREPVAVGGDLRKASVLVMEGIADSWTPNNATRSLAWQLGAIPQLAPAEVRVPDLPEEDGPILGNVDEETTAALVQYTPNGLGTPPPSPGCEGYNEGHFCPQSSPTAIRQRVDFYLSALSGIPVIE